MTDSKTATERLRELLDARGVEWWADAYDCEHRTVFDGSSHVRYCIYQLGDCLFISSILPVAPEQAVAATLGSGERTCHGESDLSEWVCSECQCWIPLGLTPENIKNASEWRYCPHCGARVVGGKAVKR